MKGGGKMGTGGVIDMGQVVWDPSREDLPRGRVVEPNTHVEDEVYDALSAYVSEYTTPPPRIIGLIRSAMADSNYSAFFSPPARDAVLTRGIHDVDGEVLSRWLGIRVGDLPERGSAIVNMTIRPRAGRTVMSFSTSVEAARNFSAVSTGDGFNVIFWASPGDNPGEFLDFSAGIYSTDPMSGLEHEHEVLALGPVKVNQIDWWRSK